MAAIALERLRRQSPVVRIALGCAVVVAVALLHVNLHVRLIEAGYAVSREARWHHQLEEQNRRLRLELATRKDPAVIERRASEELKMAPPAPQSIRALPGPLLPAKPAHPGPPGGDRTEAP